jgi:hypothetical protein
MSTGREQASLDYHDHYVIAGSKARIILNALITPADVMVNAPDASALAAGDVPLARQTKAGNWRHDLRDG